MSSWVDSHCHLHMSDADPGVLLDRAAAVGVEWLVCPGTDVEGSEAALALSEAYPGRVLAASGLHPHDASRWPEEADRIAELAARSVAIGECGLDFYRNLSPHDEQLQAFRAQVVLAEDLDIPLIVHVRAWDPDSTTTMFQYGLRVEGMSFLFDGIGEPSTEGIFERKIEMLPREGFYTLEVRIDEDALYDDGKGKVIRQVPFYVMD